MHEKMKKVSPKKLIKIAGKIKLLILDVDGVLTDGSIILDNKNNEFKMFHVRDGHGIKMLIQSGIQVALITGRDSHVVLRRAQELGIKEIFQKCHDKTTAYRQLAKKYALHDSEIAYIGDDIVDIPVLRICGLPVTIADDEVKSFTIMVTKKEGGKGAVRQVCDLLLKAQGFWEDIINGYFQT